MRNLLFIALIVGIFSCQSKPDQEIVGTYGEEITEMESISVSDMMNLLEDNESVAVQVRGEITATCAVKGCWMNLVLPEGEEMRVTFKDYGFFVPKEGMEGNEALIDGVVTRTITDVETLKHYAADAGQTQASIDAITEPKEELAFVANGVIIYKTEEPQGE